jgi:hypothetical protein
LKLTRPTAGLEPRDREIPRNSGRKPRAGRQRRASKGAAHASHFAHSSKTPGIGRGGLVAVKVAGGCRGAGRKVGAHGTVREGNTRRRSKPRRGAESRLLNRCRRPPHPPGEQGPEAEGAAHGGNSAQPRRTTARGQVGRRKSVVLRAGDNPLKGEPWTWQRGETNPQGRWWRKPSWACETPWTDRSASWEPRACVDAAG